MKSKGARAELPRIQKVNRNFYIAVPKAVRDKLGLEEGDWISIDVAVNVMLVKKINPSKI